MKKSILLLAFTVLASMASAQTSKGTQAIKITAPDAKYHNNDSVAVRRLKGELESFVIIGNGYYRDHSKQVVYDCEAMDGTCWYRLPERSIKIKFSK